MCSSANRSAEFRHRIVSLVAGLYQQNMLLWLFALSALSCSGGQLLVTKKVFYCVVSAFTAEPFSTRGTAYCNDKEIVGLTCHTVQRKGRKY